MKIKVYGYSHSPWVQAVLLALFDKRVEHILYQNPPIEVFKKWGVYMPAISINDEPWEVESISILQKFDYEEISPEELKAANKAWQGVLHRLNSPLRFFSSFWVLHPIGLASCSLIHVLAEGYPAPSIIMSSVGAD